MNSRTEVYLTAFRRFLDEGMTPLEASKQFDKDKLNSAWSDYLGEPEARELLDLCVLATGEEMDGRQADKALELWLAGWTSERPEGSLRTDYMSFYWRAPPKRPNKPGRRYLSTDQAFKAMKAQHPSAGG